MNSGSDIFAENHSDNSYSINNPHGVPMKERSKQENLFFANRSDNQEGLKAQGFNDFYSHGISGSHSTGDTTQPDIILVTNQNLDKGIPKVLEEPPIEMDGNINIDKVEITVEADEDDLYHKDTRYKGSFIGGPAAMIEKVEEHTLNAKSIIQEELSQISRRQGVNKVFLFANPSSGGRMARVYTKLEFESCNMKNENIKLHIYDLKMQDSVYRGIAEIEAYTEALKNETAPPLKVIVAGGDGTFTNLIDDLLKKSIDLHRVQSCILPFGTGNDLARVCGWGGAPTKKMKNISTLMDMVSNANVEAINLWEVVVKVEETKGEIQIIEGKNKRKALPCKTFTKLMANYMTFGTDARIGLGFDKSRTSSKFLNKMVYFWEGVKKFAFTKTNTIREVIDTVTQELKEGSESQQKVLFSTRKDSATSNYIHGNPVSLVFTNISSFMGGRTNLWKSGKGSCGLSNLEGKKLKGKQIFNEEHSYNDDKLELHTFNSVVDMLMCKGTRIGQEEGPFTIKFREHPKKLTTYMSVDGEYYRLVNPESVQIRLCDRLDGGKIQILMNSQRSFKNK